eukprot:CAMPEP_0114524624 /NCGR_PEP_ID=MMETSP0109-20121206/21961_1 /TAXON_ID=29199 /ORGANISM="Chlorarachnion reptans, Strain CCCM449" /LENGTH=280 /DNA_ID=CAMNT_0001706093 /DNA_START=219 /DNA_END=1061 /DNA_ORIENTATION=-
MRSSSEAILCSCRFKDVGCPASLPAEAMTKHLEESTKSHLKLVVRALRKEQNENDFYKEAMTCAQSRCRKVEMKNVDLRRRIDMMKSRLEGMQLSELHQELFLRLLEVDPEAIAICHELHAQELEKMRKAKEGSPASEEEVLMNQLQSSLERLERENMAAREELRKLTEQLEIKRADADSTEEKDSKEEAIYVMGIPISLGSKPMEKIKAPAKFTPGVNPGLLGVFRRMWGGNESRSTPVDTNRGSKGPNPELLRTIEKWDDKTQKIRLIKKALKKSSYE